MDFDEIMRLLTALERHGVDYVSVWNDPSIDEIQADDLLR